MPSPFPGMDPYLEQSGVWPDFHASVITYARDALNERLPRGYLARIDERFGLVELPWRSEKDRVIEPDVAVMRRAPAAGPASMGAGAATLEPVIMALPAQWVEVRSTRLEVRHRAGLELVTVIELLSPSNKVEPGHGEYLSKRKALIHRRVNLVEIDLLASGRRLPMSCPLPLGDYYAFVARGPELPDCSVYAWTVRMPLPTIPIPLHDPDPDVPLDLAAVVAMAYERSRYDESIDYQARLTVPLGPDDRAWAETRARGADR